MTDKAKEKKGFYLLYVDFIKGFWKENPVFLQLLGMCPTLAVTTSAENGLFMGFSVIFLVFLLNSSYSLQEK